MTNTSSKPVVAEKNADESALRGSINAKKDISYYYAHAPRETTEQPAAMPVHTPIAKEAYVPGERVITIKTFQFLDDNEFAKVYLPLENLDKITKDDISTTFEASSFSVTICGLKDAPMQFSVTKLHNTIVPSECLVKVLKTKVLIKLKKVAEEDNQIEEPDFEVENKVEPEAGAPDATAAKDVDLDQQTDRAEKMQLSDEVQEDAANGDADRPVKKIQADKEKEVKKGPKYPHWYSLRAS